MPSATDTLYLALDQGGSQSRALVIDGRGQIIAHAAQAVATRRPQPGWVEQSPQALLGSLRAAAEQAVDQLATTQRRQLISCGLACQRSSLLAWNHHAGAALTPLISWQDTRGAALMPGDPAAFATLHQISGLYPSAHHGASKFAWLLQHVPAVREAAAEQRLGLLPLASFLAQALFGRHAIDPANAQRTLLWDYQRGDWSPELLALFAVDRTWLPPLLPSRADWGQLSVADLNLPCRLLAGDQSVAPLAAGMPADGQVQINLGTGAFLCTPDHHYPSARLLHSVAYSDGEQGLAWLEGTVNGAGAALQWLEQAGDALPAQSGRPEAGAIFLNAVGGLGSPFWRSDLHSRFLDTPGPQRSVAVRESILFLLQENLREMAAAGVPLHRLRLSGGLSQTPGMAQQLANLSALPVELLAEPEATARGLAWVLADGPSQWHSAPPRHYSPAPDPALQHRYRAWQQAMARWLA